MRTNVLFVSILLFAILPVIACGYGSNYNGGSMMNNVAPTITELVPKDIAAGSGNFIMTVNGTNFGTAAIVYWKGGPLTTSYLTSKQITAAVPASNVATADNVSVYVRSGGMNSNSVTFKVESP